MSGIAGIYNIPGNPNELSVWSTTHATHHRDAINTVYRIAQTQLTQYILDPFDPNDPQGWLAQHQQAHDDMNGILGLSGLDLLQVDFRKQDDLSAWILNNASEHMQWSNILEIG